MADPGVATSGRGGSVRMIGTVLIVLAIVAYTVLLGGRVTDSGYGTDGEQTVVAAYNLVYNGVISDDPGPDPEPTNSREPLPIVLYALHMALHPALPDQAAFADLLGPAETVAVKSHNLLWAVLLMLGIAVLVGACIRPVGVSLIATLATLHLTYLFFLQNDLVIDSAYTELQAATLLVWISVALLVALRTGRVLPFVATGLLFGALILTKAVFLYVGIGLALCLIGLYAVLPAPGSALGPRLRALGLVAAMAAAMSAVVLPWMARNAVQFGSWDISQRSGEVLIIRATKNQMTHEEFLGAFYVWAPPSWITQRLLGDPFGFTPEDETSRDGRLRRLNRGPSDFAESDAAAREAGRPEDAISFYRATRAERVRLRALFAAEGAENPEHRADDALRAQAVAMIRADPVAHLKTTPAFLFRGIWSFRSETIGPEFRVLANAAGYAALWALALAGLWRRSPEMLAIALVPVGAIAFYAIASHFIPRYAMPAVPNMLIAATVAAAWTATLLVGRRRPSDGGAPLTADA